MSQSTIYRRHLRRYNKHQEKSALDDRPAYMRVLAGLPVVSYLIPSSSAVVEDASLKKAMTSKNMADDAKYKMTSQVPTSSSNNNKLPCALLGISGVTMLASKWNPPLPFLVLYSNARSRSSTLMNTTRSQPRSPRIASLYYTLVLSATFASGAVRSLRARASHTSSFRHGSR